MFSFSRKGLLSLAELACLSIGLVMLFEQSSLYFREILHHELNPDVWEFIASSKSNGFFYTEGSREPLHVFFLKAGLWLIDGEERAVRFTSLLESMLGLVLFFWAARHLVGRLPAMIAVILVGANPVLAFYSVSGMRAPLYFALVMLWAGLLAQTQHSFSRYSGIRMGGAAALLVLTRVYAIAFLVGSLLIYFSGRLFQKRAPHPLDIRSLFQGLGIFLLLTLPDFFLRRSGHINIDLARMRHFENEGNILVGADESSVGLLDYVLSGRQLFGVLSQLLDNLWRFFSDYLPFFFQGYNFLVLFFPLGVLLAVHRRNWLLAGVAFTSLLPFLWVLGYDLEFPGSGVENRLVLHAFPLFLLWGLDSCSQLIFIGYNQIRSLLQFPPGENEALASALLLPPCAATQCAQEEQPHS
jgi:hypothetical protein